MTALIFIGLYAAGAMAGQTYTDRDLNGGNDKKPKKEKKTKRKLGLQHASDVKIYFSGEHNGNRHVVFLKDPGREVVVGHITAMSNRGITMDGVYYDLGRVEILDNYMRAVTLDELYVGLKVNLKLFYGSLEKVTIYNLKRLKADVLPPGTLKKRQEDRVRQRNIGLGLDRGGQ